MKEIIKIPIQSTEEGVSSIGYEGINLQQNRNRKTMQGFFKPKRGSSSTFVTIDKYSDMENSIPVKTERRRKGLKDTKDLSTVDLYFFERCGTNLRED